MSILKVARMGHPVLRTRARRAEPPEITSPAFQKLIDDMMETMEEYHGIGLAAPQVHESVRLVLVGIEDGRDGEDAELRLIPVINPEIIPVGSEVAEDWEGCLSVPNLRGRVPRAVEVRLRGLDRKGGRLDLGLRGFPARVAQHEADHLDGILFVHRMKSLETLTFLEEFGKYWQKD
jgi:peptide deformylase